MSYSSDDDEEPRSSRSPVPQGLFSDSEDDGERETEDERRKRLADDEEEEEERKREEKRKQDEEKKKKQKPKGPVRRQLISEDMLTGKNGIYKLPEIFEDFKFGGKGREKEDLNKVLAKLEYWVHCLHPKQPFDQCLQRIEFLGLKRKVIKTHLKKVRMGMNDFTCPDQKEDEEVMQQYDDDDDNELEHVESAVQTATAVVSDTPQLSQFPDASEFPDEDDEFDFAAIDNDDMTEAVALAEAAARADAEMADACDNSEEFDNDVQGASATHSSVPNSAEMVAAKLSMEAESASKGDAPLSVEVDNTETINTNTTPSSPSVEGDNVETTTNANQSEEAGRADAIESMELDNDDDQLIIDES